MIVYQPKIGRVPIGLEIVFKHIFYELRQFYRTVKNYLSSWYTERTIVVFKNQEMRRNNIILFYVKNIL